MCKNTFICDVCKEIVQEKDGPLVKKSFLGIEFDSSNKLVVRSHYKTCRHICYDCARDISAIFVDKKQDWIV